MNDFWIFSIGVVVLFIGLFTVFWSGRGKTSMDILSRTYVVYVVLLGLAVFMGVLTSWLV